MQKELVCLQVEGISDNKEALNYLAQKLVDIGAVKQSFIQSVIDRELIFPTGLQFEEYGIAIPHTDSEHANETQLAIMTLKNPVNFIQMATNNQIVKVRLIIMLAIKNPHAQVEMLQKLMNVLQNPIIVQELLSYKNCQQDAVIDVLFHHHII